MMSPNRNYSILAALLLALLGGVPALGQDHELRGMQLFEEVDARPYGNWAKPNEGFFFSFEGIYWHISKPDFALIGQPGTVNVFPVGNAGLPVPETSTLNTGEFRDKWKQGDRFEVGFVGEHHGLMITTFELNRQTMHLSGFDVPVVFTDPKTIDGGLGFLDKLFLTPDGTGFIGLRTPVVFDHVTATNRFKPEGVEVLYMYRPHQLHNGGQLEWLLGGRYLQLHDDFFVNATGGNLADCYWDTDVKNRIAGPEIGLRWSHPIGRFSISSEGRFMAGINSQSVRQRGELGSQLTGLNAQPAPFFFQATGFEHTAIFTEFTPLVEFRVEGHVRVTRQISLKAGYTFTYMDGIARSADMINYTVPTMGISTLHDANRQEVLMHGLTLGIELNR